MPGARLFIGGVCGPVGMLDGMPDAVELQRL